MRRLIYLIPLILFAVSKLAQTAAPNVPVIQIKHSINPGTADYIISAIDDAEKSGAPFLILEMDTPGGLLNSTRLIVQRMLNAKVPIVVFVGPKGAQAGSAGAIITFAADVAAMAPGTNIGAAHPVSGSGEKTEGAMEDKITNDTAAFAESLAKTKGRNSAWAIKAVKESASVIAEEALKLGVIDLMADDLDDLTKKLAGYKLKVRKGEIAALPSESVTATAQPMTLKHRIVSFFADPNLAYLIMTLGGLCIWVELSHPGLIVPGVLGGICILLSLISFQLMPISYGALAMILIGMALMIAELYLPTFGVLGVGGLISFVLGSLFLMDTNVPEFQISLALILPTAATLAAAAVGLGILVMRSRHRKVAIGVQTLIGQYAKVKDPISASEGRVMIEGELWNAVVEEGHEPLPVGSIAVVTQVKGMLLVVRAHKA